jgi:hypothetical protein
VTATRTREEVLDDLAREAEAIRALDGQLNAHRRAAARLCREAKGLGVGPVDMHRASGLGRPTINRYLEQDEAPDTITAGETRS